MSKPLAAFPTLATDSQFSLSFDNYSTTLSAPVLIGDTTISLTDPTKAPTDSILTIGSEKLFVTAGGSNPVSVTRAFDGSSAAAYGQGSVVAVNVVAYSHNSLVSEIEAVEQGIPFLSAAVFNFTPIALTTPLTGGISNTITLANVPQGVNGTDVGHYLYITDGGNSEAVLITGGTAVAGGVNKTLTFTPTNGHTSYTISSSSGGIQEALIGVSGKTKTRVWIDQDITIYAPITLSQPCSIQGTEGITLTWAGTAASNIFILANSNIDISHLKIAAGNSGSAITNSGTYSTFRISKNLITGGAVPIHFTLGSHIIITENDISGFTDSGIVLSTSVNLNYAIITHNIVDSTSSTSLNGSCISAWGSHTVIDGNICRIGGNADQAITWINNSGAGLEDGVITNNYIELVSGDAFEGIGIGSAINFVVNNNTIKAMGPLTRVGQIGIEVTESSYGVVSDNLLAFNHAGTQLTGIAVYSSSYINVCNNVVTDWPTDAGSNAIALFHIDTSNPASGQMSYNRIFNNILKQTSLTAVNSNIRFETLVTGNVLNNIIKQNSILGNTASGYIGILCTNSGAATVTNLEISENSVETCDTGIQITGTNTWLNQNKYIGCTTRLVDNGTGTKIDDMQDTAVATVASGTSIAAAVDNKYFKITGTTTVTTITGGWVGRRITIFKTDASNVTIGGGGNIPLAHTLTQYGSLDLLFDGTNWY